MRNDLVLSPWRVEHCGSAPQDDFLESIFFLGNGRMGVRGYLPCGRDSLPVKTGLYLAGMFGEIKSGITDIVNLPTPCIRDFYLDGEKATVTPPIRRDLDLRSAVLTLSFRISAGEKTADVSYQRFFPKEQPSLLLQRTQVRAAQSVEVRISAGTMTTCCNSPIPDDQTKENPETLCLSELSSLLWEPDGYCCRYHLTGTGLHMRETNRFACVPPVAMTTGESSRGPSVSMTFPLAPGGDARLDELTCIETSRDADPRIHPCPGSWDYDALQRDHSSAWAAQWARCWDNTSPDGELQCALQYAELQLLCSCSGRDPTVSIGARGLTHGRYKGCYFWDTDLFMLPFYLESDPEAAKNLCLYRVGTLDAARAHAKEMNTAGARYPWMAALDGSEQCETWDIGCSEVHVTADVVYAIDQYCTRQGDESFYLDKACEVYIETARFWRSRYTYHPKSGTSDLLFCKGPDEYCGVTSNNLYTNVMVQHNLELACRAADALKVSRPELYAHLGVTDGELAAWEHLRDTIPWPRDPYTGRLTTDDSFHLLERVELSQIKHDEAASYHTVCFDRLQRYKVVKQADVLLLMTRLPELFSPAEKRAAWEDFEPICLHDSTLSFASHALFAAQNGLRAQAEAYLRKALLLDLRDVMGNTGKEGLHLACMGEAWQAAQRLCQS